MSSGLGTIAKVLGFKDNDLLRSAATSEALRLGKAKLCLDPEPEPELSELPAILDRTLW